MFKQIISEIRTIILAIFIAFIVWMAAVIQENPITTGMYSSKIPVQITPPVEKLIILEEKKLPSSVHVELRAPQSTWQNLSINQFEGFIDLSEYQVGLHNVPVNINILHEKFVEVRSVPSQVNVELVPLQTKVLSVTVELKGDIPIGFVSRSPTTDPISATVKGPTKIVDLVEHVVAEIYIANQKETIEKNISLIPLNVNREKVKGVMIEPTESFVHVPIEQRFGYKEFAVKAIITGTNQLPNGYWISGITVEPATIMLIGGPNVLKNVTGFIETVEIDVSNATEDVVKRTHLNLPPGSSLVQSETEDEHSQSVLVTVNITALSGGMTVKSDITVQGMSDDITWSVAPEQVEVILSGSLPSLQNLAEDDVTVLLNIFDLPVGTHHVAPEIITPPGLEVASIIPDMIEVTITEVDANAYPTIMIPLDITDTIIITDVIQPPTLNTSTNVISDR